MLPTAAVKVAVVAPDATVTDAGTPAAALLLDSDTTAPPPEAGCVMVTVQEELLPELTVVGLHETLLKLVRRMTAMLPPVPLAETLLPPADAAATLVTAIFRVPVAPAESVAFTTATVPFAIVFWFRPEMRHVYEPLPEVQFRVLDALVAAVPAYTVKLAKLAAL